MKIYLDWVKEKGMRIYLDWVNGFAIGIGILHHFQTHRLIIYINLGIIELGIYWR